MNALQARMLTAKAKKELINVEIPDEQLQANIYSNFKIQVIEYRHNNQTFKSQMDEIYLSIERTSKRGENSIDYPFSNPKRLDMENMELAIPLWAIADELSDQGYIVSPGQSGNVVGNLIDPNRTSLLIMWMYDSYKGFNFKPSET